MIEGSALCFDLLVERFDVAVVDGNAKHGDVGVSVVPYDGFVVVHTSCRAHEPIGIGS